MHQKTARIISTQGKHFKALALCSLAALNIFSPAAMAYTTELIYSGAPIPIPDATPAGVNIPLNLSDTQGSITALAFQFDAGTSCNGVANNLNAAVIHPYVADLSFKLTSPSGTSVVFWHKRGGKRDNICGVLITDDGLSPLPGSITDVDGAPVSGTYQSEPTGLLSSFVGENPNGTWTLNVSDTVFGDLGSLQGFRLRITTPDNVNASCGSAANTPSLLAPVANRCSPGSVASVVTSNTGNFTWSCPGWGTGSSAQCAAPRQYGLTTSSSIGGNINCNASQVTAGGTFTCTATASPGYYFVTWSGDCTGDAACVLTNVVSAKSINATFAAGSPPFKSVPTMGPMALLILIVSLIGLGLRNQRTSA
jgi:subtilisin-like proprotein convertase family protein